MFFTVGVLATTLSEGSDCTGDDAEEIYNPHAWVGVHFGIVVLLSHKPRYSENLSLWILSSHPIHEYNQFLHNR